MIKPKSTPESVDSSHENPPSHIGLIVHKHEQEIAESIQANRSLLSRISLLDDKPLGDLDTSLLIDDYFLGLSTDNLVLTGMANNLKKEFLDFMKECIEERKLPENKPSTLLCSLLRRANILSKNDQWNESDFSALLNLYKTQVTEGISLSNPFINFLVNNIPYQGESVVGNPPEMIVESYSKLYGGSNT